MATTKGALGEGAKKNAEAALRQLLEVKTGERVLVVTDERTRPIGDTFCLAAEALGARAAIYSLPEDRRPLAELPPDLPAMIPGTNVGVTCFAAMAQETPFRVVLIRTLMANVRRLAHGPGMTPAMLEGGPMSVDYAEMAMRAANLMRRFEGATVVRITTPGGTDLEIGVAGRAFTTDTVIPDGHWGNVPAGEIWCGPVEDAADGLLVCDGSIGDLGQVPSPVKLTVRKGRVEAVDGADAPFRARLEELLAVDDQARVIGEMGIGLNRGARVTGILLEDEKAVRTVHIAFGCNDFMPGGKNKSRTHRDFLMHRPTVTVTFADGRTERLLDDGEITAA